MTSFLPFIGILLLCALVNGQRRVTARGSASSGGDPDDDLSPIRGVTRPSVDSGSGSGSGSGSDSDSASFSVTDRDSDSGSRRDRRRSTRMPNNNGDEFPTNSDRDTGFDRLTTQRGGDMGNGDRDVADALDRRRTTPGFFGGGDRDRDSGSSNGDRDHDSRWSSSPSSRLDRFPENYRVEVEVQRLENKGSILATGSSCDVLSACDTKLYAIIETEKPLSAWPGSVPLAKWPVIFTVTNVDSPAIAKTVARDICQQRDALSSQQVSLRVRAVDADTLTAEDEINKFDCLFTITPASLGSDPATAQWSDSMECKPTSQVGKIKLFARQRAYQISSSNCNSQAF